MVDAITTQVLIEHVQQGDRSALDELCNRYLMRVLAAVRIRLGAGLRRKLESADIVQEVMMDALRKVETFDFRTEGAFLKYLNQVVENRIRDQADHWAAQRRDPAREAPLNAEGSSGSSIPLEVEGPHSAATPSKVAMLGEDLLRLEQALDQLPADHRELLVAVKIEGREYGELAEEIGLSPDAVRMQVNRAMSQLAKVYQQMESGGPADAGTRRPR